MKKNKFKSIINKPRQKIDKAFERYYDKNYSKNKSYRERYSFMLENIIGSLILDCGCATGLLEHLLYNRSDIKEIHGIDLQESALNEARKNVKSDKVLFHNCFVEDLPFENEYFNTVVYGETLEHVYSVSEALKEAARVLKSNGRIVITCPHEGKISELHVRSISIEFLKERIEKYFRIEMIKIQNYLKFNQKFIFCIGVKLK